MIEPRESRADMVYRTTLKKTYGLEENGDGVACEEVPPHPGSPPDDPPLLEARGPRTVRSRDTRRRLPRGVPERERRGVLAVRDGRREERAPYLPSGYSLEESDRTCCS